MADRSRAGFAVQSTRPAFPHHNNEITLFKEGLPVLKAEQGVTLGLLKLIYSSDESNNGILLGVKPRISNQVPCLVTFDNTSLSHSEYDLIVQETTTPPVELLQSTASKEQISDYNLHGPVSIAGNITSSCDRTDSGDQNSPLNSSRKQSLREEPFDSLRDLGTSSGDDHEKTTNTTHDQWKSPGTLNQAISEPLDPGPFVLGAHLPTQHGSLDVIPSIDDEESVTPDSSVRELGDVDFVVSKSTTVNASDRGTSGRRSPVCSVNAKKLEDVVETPEPDSNTPEEIQFIPEDFDFDINSVTPFQSDKGTRWPCDRCGKDFCSSSHLKRHWILHTDFKPFKCKVCNKCFPFHWDLKKHMTRHTGDKPFKCPSCTKSFNTRKELKYHDWLHTGKKEYECHVCHHEFTSPGNLKVHMRKHTGEKPYKCEYCPKSFHMQGHYQYHVRRHTGEKPYQCDICGKAFSYSNNLNEHKNVHTGYRPYSCCHCDKKFTHRSTLKQHVLMHEGSKPYKCHVCAKSFVQSSNYRMHLLTHKNREDRAQKCDLCGKELLSRRGVRKHRLRCVKRTVERANANKPTRKNQRLKRGEYHCEHCPKIFAYNRRLEEHVTRKHSAPTEECAIEPSAISDDPNIPGQSTTPWKSPRQLPRVRCPVCGRQFTYTKRLKEHLEKAHQTCEVEEIASPTIIPRQSPTLLPVTSTTTHQDTSVSPERPQTSGTSGTPCHGTVTCSPTTTHPQEVPNNTTPTQKAPIVWQPNAPAQPVTAVSSVSPLQPAGAQIAAPSNVTILYVTSPSVLPRPVPLTSLATGAGKYVPIVPKPPAAGFGPQPVYGLSYVTGSPVVAIPRENPLDNSAMLWSGRGQMAGTFSLSRSHALSTRQQSFNRILHPDRKDPLGNGETGFQALSALERLSAKIGMEEDASVFSGKEANQSFSVLEQFSTKVGNGNVVLVSAANGLERGTAEAQAQIPLRFPRLKSQEERAEVPEGLESNLGPTSPFDVLERSNDNAEQNILCTDRNAETHCESSDAESFTRQNASNLTSSPSSGLAVTSLLNKINDFSEVTDDVASGIRHLSDDDRSVTGHNYGRKYFVGRGGRPEFFRIESTKGQSDACSKV